MTPVKPCSGARLLLLLLSAAAAVRADPAVQPPKVIEQARPEYSEALRAAGISGEVVVQFGVDASGAVQDAKAVKSDHPELEAPAVEAVRKWKFRPAMKDGQPVATPVMRVPITFNIPPTAFRAFPSFDAALKQAEQEHKIVFIDFFTTWCGPCKLLDSSTWQDASVIALLREKTVALRVDAEKEVALANRYGVNAYPTLALIRPDGTLIDSLVGYRDAPTFTAEFTDALAGRTKLAEARAAVQKAGADAEQQAKARYDLGRELSQKGKDAEALAEFLWCFDTGMKSPSSYSGVRVSFLLQDIAILGAHYPPALDALRARRDGVGRTLAGDRDAAADFGAINHYLGEDNLTLEAFDKQPADSAEKSALGYWLFDMLIGAKRYRDALAAVPIDRFKMQFDAMRPAAAQNPSMRDYIAESAAKELEAAAGADRADDARALLKALLEFDSSETTKAAVREHLGRAGHPELMPAQSPSPAPAAEALPAPRP